MTHKKSSYVTKHFRFCILNGKMAVCCDIIPCSFRVTCSLHLRNRYMAYQTTLCHIHLIQYVIFQFDSNQRKYGYCSGTTNKKSKPVIISPEMRNVQQSAVSSLLFSGDATANRDGGKELKASILAARHCPVIAISTCSE